jgi:hypothetical protein
MQRQVEAGRRVRGDHGIGRPTLSRQRGLHPLDGRRHDGQAIGPALFEAEIDRGERVVGRLVDAG